MVLGSANEPRTLNLERSLTPWVDGRHVQTAIDEAVVLPARPVQTSGSDVGNDLVDMPVGIAEATGGEAVPLPGDDVLAAVLDQEAGAFTLQRPRDAFGDLERAVL